MEVWIMKEGTRKPSHPTHGVGYWEDDFIKLDLTPEWRPEGYRNNYRKGSISHKCAELSYTAALSDLIKEIKGD